MNNMIFLAGGLDLSSPYVLIIGASIIIVLSYIYGLIAEKTNIPSVLLLILTGVLIKLSLDRAHIELFDLMPVLEVLGIVGLIMIVLEAALDLELTKEKLPLIGKSLLIALLSLLASVFAVAGVLHYFLQLDVMTALIYATPLSIMSSAIIIPSVNNLLPEKKEFMIYESTFSDILGIMFFYFLISFKDSGGSTAAMEFGWSFIVTLIVAVVASYALIFIFKDMKGHNRLFLLISILLILYALGKLMHLSPLLIILIFGLSLANHHTFFKIMKNDLSDEDPIAKIEKDFHLITLETAFVVRTFFFVIFGMTIELASLANLNVLMISAAILVALYLMRLIFLKIFIRGGILPELFIAPRGLITILLFFAIPVSISSTVSNFDTGILLYVILISSLIMTFSLIHDSKKAKVVPATETEGDGNVVEDQH